MAQGFSVKVLIVTNFLPPKIGGIERLTHELACVLQKSGQHSVTVACAQWPEKFMKTTWAPIKIPYQVTYFPSNIVSKRLPIPSFWRASFWRAMKSLEAEYEIVIYQSHLFALNWLLALRYRNCLRRIWISHGCNYIPVESRLVGLASLIYERLGMLILRLLSNEYLASSQNASNWISQKVSKKFEIFSNAVNLELFDTPIFDIRPKKTKVLFVGRFVEGKGVLECIQSVAQANMKLQKQGEPLLFDLTIIGAGPLESKFGDIDASLEIHFKGELDHPMVISSMYAADILIQAYRQPEGLTTVTLEGLAAGMLIVTTPLSGDEQLVQCPNYEQGELEDLPNILLKMREKSESREELVKSGREFIETGFTWEIAAKILLRSGV
jgi:glycosyltransferase involved in cell wall biosynthesis